MLGGAAAIADTVLLLVIGVPYAVLWGVVSFLFSFVPNIGFVIALIPPTLLAFLDGGIVPGDRGRGGLRRRSTSRSTTCSSRGCCRSASTSARW